MPQCLFYKSLFIGYLKTSESFASKIMDFQGSKQPQIISLRGVALEFIIILKVKSHDTLIWILKIENVHCIGMK